MSIPDSSRQPGLLRRWLQAGVELSSRTRVGRGGVALADQFVASATNFATGIIVGRACAQEQFGLYMLGFSIVQLSMRLQSSLILSPYMVYSPRLRGEAHAEYTGSALLHNLGLSVLALLGLAVGGTVLSFGFGPAGLAPVVWALAVATTFILLREYARNVCFANLRFMSAFVIDSVVAVVQISVLLLLAFAGVLNAGLIFWVVGAACGIAASAWLLQSRSLFSMSLGRTLPDFRRNWSFGKWIFASSLLFDVGTYTYPWILTLFHGTASTGVWAACFGAVAITNPIILGMVNQVGPEIAHSYAADGMASLRRVVAKANTVFMVMLAPLTLVLILRGGWLVELFYGHKYVGHGLVVGLLAIDILLSPARFTLARALFVMERADADFLTNLAPLVMLLVLGIWLVRAFGPAGVAVAILVGDTSAATVKLVTYSLLARREQDRVGA